MLTEIRPWAGPAKRWEGMNLKKLYGVIVAMTTPFDRMRAVNRGEDAAMTPVLEAVVWTRATFWKI